MKPLPYRGLWSVTLVILLLVMAGLACAAGSDNITIGDVPQYVCPSATPRPTHTQSPADPPRYPAYFDVNLKTTTYQGMGPITLQLAMQNSGTVYARYSGARRTYPYSWEGSNGQFVPIGSALPTPTTTEWWLYVPSDVYRVDFTVYATQQAGYHYLTAYQSTLSSTPQPPPCCAPPPVFPTTRPTFTPYPSPTPYLRENDYFVGDIVYTAEQAAGLQVGFRMLSIDTLSTTLLDDHGQPQAIHRWTLQVSNVGSIPYTIFPPAQTYTSLIRQPATERSGVWGPSLAAAAAAGIDFSQMTWDMQDIPPGESRTFVLAAFGPVGETYKVSYVMNASTRRTGPDPTEVPGTNLVSWINEINTICSGDIQEP